MQKTRDKKLEKQIRSFAADDSMLNDYNWFEVARKDFALVRIMRYTEQPNKKSSLIGVNQELYTQDHKGDMVTSSEAKSAYIPLVKLIKVNSDREDLQPGGLFSVPTKDVVGTIENPDALFAAQFKAAKNLDPIQQQRIPDRILAIHHNWNQYMVIHPFNMGPDKNDILTYCIPVGKLIGEIDVREC